MKKVLILTLIGALASMAWAAPIEMTKPILEKTSLKSQSNTMAGNDNCPGLPVVLPFTETGTTADNGDFNGNGSPDEWYEFAAPGGSDITVSLCGSAYDTYLRIYATDCVSELYSNDDSCGTQSELVITAMPAGTYEVCVEGWSTNSGDFVILIEEDTPPPPPTWPPVNPTIITGIPYAACGTTVGGVNDYDAVCPYGGSTAEDVAYSYTPFATEIVDLTLCNDDDLCPTDYDTKMYIADGTWDTVSDPLYCNDDACTSNTGTSYVSELVGVTLNGGTTYYIIIDGYGGSAGNYNLQITYWEEPPPPPPFEECPENTLFGQTPVHPDEAWSGTTSDIAPGYKVYDNYWDVFEPICDLHWWGLMAYYDPTYGWMACVEDPMPFLIEFWYSYLDAMPLCSYQMLVTPVDTGFMYGGFPLYYFSVVLDPCCYTQDNGYVSIQGIGDVETCWFLWAGGVPGDLFAIQGYPDGTFATLDHDMAFCLTWGDVTDVDVPRSIELNQNYPNPFNPTTTIQYSLTQPETVNLSVYNLAGELVTTLVNNEVVAGTHTAEFDATNLPSGVYFYTLSAGDFSQTKKMVLVK